MTNEEKNKFHRTIPFCVQCYLEMIENHKKFTIKLRTRIFDSFLYRIFGIGKSRLIEIDSHFDEIDQFAHSCCVSEKKLMEDSIRLLADNDRLMKEFMPVEGWIRKQDDTE